MVKMGDAIDDDSPHEDLHELRKKGKELRYLLEFFAGLFPADTVDPMVKRLKALQDTLGRFQDREVQAAMLRSLGPDIAASRDGAPALMAMGVLVEHLGAQQAQARAEFAERFARFASKHERAAVEETFG
jgi:CHAD domain-containing protein